jgi:cytochrome d ubiquinol oxidase subunit I
MNELQAQYVQKYGPGNYIPPVFFNYWTFRIMVGAGMLMLLLIALLIYLSMRNRLERSKRFLAWIPLAILLPFLANTAGWMLTEMGRQPWVVFGLLKTQDAVSPNVAPGVVLASLIVFALVYGVLMVVDVYLLQRFARLGPVEETPERKFADEGFHD